MFLFLLTAANALGQREHRSRNGFFNSDYNIKVNRTPHANYYRPNYVPREWRPVELLTGNVRISKHTIFQKFTK